MDTGPAKEGVVLDADGKTLFSPDSSESVGSGARARVFGGTRAQIRVYRGGWWLPLALGVGIPLLFVAGIFIFTLLMSIGIVIFLLRSFFGYGRPLGSR